MHRHASFCLFALTLPLAVEMHAAPVGVVLSGGGAMGAYEVGVWQALQASGLSSNVTAISGSSVGAINAALFATKPESAERVWFENMGSVFTVSPNRVGGIVQKLLDDASKAMDFADQTGKEWAGWADFANSTMSRVWKLSEDMDSDKPCPGIIDSSKLADALDNTLPREWPATAPAVYATAVEKGACDASATWHLNAQSHDRRVLMLRASAAIPFGFDTVMIDGKPYVDGGYENRGGDNAPIGPILRNHPDIKTVVAVYLIDDENRRAKNRADATANGVRLVEIAPTEKISGLLSVGGVFDTRPKTAKRLIELGRRDAEAVLKKEGLWTKTGLR